MLTDRRTSALLSAPGARRLLASSLVARLPLAMFSIAILVHTQRLTGSFVVAGFASSGYAICGAMSAPALGRLVDRCGQTFVVVAGSIVTAGVLICAGLLPAGCSRPLPVALAAAAGLATPPLAACVRTLVPKIVACPSDLPALFAFESTLLELTFVFGPPLALGLGALWSTGGALIVSGVVMVGGALAFAAQPASRSWRPEPAPQRSRSGSLQSAAIRTLIAVQLGTGIVFGASEVGVTAAAKHLASAAAAAPTLGLWGLGSLIGGMVATRMGGGAKSVRGLVALVAALALAHGALVFGAGSLPVLCLIILVAGATIAPTAATVYALVDRTAPAGTQTEAFSWLATASSAGAALGAAIAGGLAQSSGPGAAFALAGAAGLLAAAAAGLRSRYLVAPAPAVLPQLA
jgi:MFS family permease